MPLSAGRRSLLRVQTGCGTWVARTLKGCMPMDRDEASSGSSQRTPGLKPTPHLTPPPRLSPEEDSPRRTRSPPGATSQKVWARVVQATLAKLSQPGCPSPVAVPKRAVTSDPCSRLWEDSAPSAPQLADWRALRATRTRSTHAEALWALILPRGPRRTSALPQLLGVISPSAGSPPPGPQQPSRA